MFSWSWSASFLLFFLRAAFSDISVASRISSSGKNFPCEISPGTQSPFTRPQFVAFSTKSSDSERESPPDLIICTELGVAKLEAVTKSVTKTQHNTSSIVIRIVIIFAMNVIQRSRFLLPCGKVVTGCHGLYDL